MEGRPGPAAGGRGGRCDGHAAYRRRHGNLRRTPESTAFNEDDWALFSGLPAAEPKEKHQKAFVELVEDYFDEHVEAYKDIGTEGIPGKNGGDYDFLLRDIVALIHIFVDRPDILTNCMIRKLIGQDQISFSSSGGDCASSDGACTTTGSVPFAGQDLDEWLAAGPNGRHFFRLGMPDVPFPANLLFPTLPDAAVEISTPETENHLLGIYAWRFLVNEYLTFVASLTPEDKRYYRFDPCLKNLVQSDPARYTNGPAMIDFVLQLLGRIPHSGMFESNAKPYGAYAISPILAFYQAADLLCPDNPERQKIKGAAQNALNYLAAEFAFQSFEGKRMAPFRRNYDHRNDVTFYASDYVPHIFGVLTGAYVFPDGETGPYHWERIGQEGGFALWALLSGYRVPRAIHDFMLNKHGGYFARIQTRYTRDSYPFNLMIDPGGITDLDPAFARPRYFQDMSSGEVPPESYDVVGPGEFTPVTQLYFATPDYLNSAGGHNAPYYFEIKVPSSLIELLIIGVVLPPIAGVLALIADQLNEAINGIGFVQKLRGSDVNSRPSVLITRGDILVPKDSPIETLERVLPAMRGQDDYWASRNLSTYKSFSLGYTFNPDDDDRHLDWPQRYPAAWNDFRIERFGIGRASVHVFDFTAQPEHPLAGHYWVLAQFSKSENKGQFREYGRGFWEVVPGHQFPNARALAAHIRDTNPASHFDNDEDHHYTYRLASTGERVVIHNRFGSTATDQAILEIRTPDESPIPLNTYTADLRDEAALRQIPLMDVWQVDRDYNFTGMQYAHADGRGRVVIHNPFVGETLILDSSDYRAPTRSSDTAAFITTQLPAIGGTQGQLPSVSALALDSDVIYAAHFFSTDPWQPSTQPGELVALDRHTLAPMKRVTVGQAPHAIAIHHATQRLYVVNYQDHSLAVIDGGSFTVLDTLVFPGWGEHGVAVSQKYHRVFVTQFGQKRVLVIDGQTRTQLDPMNNLPLTGDIVVDEATDRLYVIVKNDVDARRQDVVEFEISAQGQRELRRTTMDGQVSRASEMAVDAERLYVINNGPQTSSIPGQKLTVLDRRTLEVVGIVPLHTGGGLGVAASASQNVIYVTTINNIQVIDARTLCVMRKIPLNASQVKSVVAVDEQTGAAYSGGSGSSTLTLSGPPLVALGQ